MPVTRTINNNNNNMIKVEIFQKEKRSRDTKKKEE